MSCSFSQDTLRYLKLTAKGIYVILNVVKNQNRCQEMIYMRQLQRIAQGIVAFVLCAVLLCGTVFADVGGSPFPDVPENADYAEAAATLAEFGIFEGDSTGNFNPNKTISRAEAAAVICRVMGVEEEAKQLTTAVFTDVPASHWAVGYVAKAAELGIIGGYGNGKFGPSDPVTYAQMVKMLVCAGGWAEEALAYGGWPNGYLQVADESGYTRGIAHSANDAIPRSSVAVLVYNTLFG